MLLELKLQRFYTLFITLLQLISAPPLFAAESTAPHGDLLPAAPDLYQEPYRPQFHVTARQWTVRKLNPQKQEEGWINDVNGLIYHQGQYHLFAQRWAKCWLHFVSKDLVHWTELQPAFWEDERFGTGVQSGSIVFDRDNVSGLSVDPKHPPLVAFWSGFDNQSQCISFSVDHALTWKKYPGNPYMVRPERDPKVFWYEPGHHWVMALYADAKYHLLNSTNLLTWVDQKNPIPECFECPDLFPLPVEGDRKHQKWVLVRGNGKYSIGEFDGSKFTAETEQLPCDLGANFYATQSWGDISGQPGRRVQIAWMQNGKYPDMPFNQQLTFPCDLTLHSYPEGLRISRWPAKEIQSIHGRGHTWKNTSLAEVNNLLKGVGGDLFDIELRVQPGEAAELGLKCNGQTISYNPKSGSLSFLGKAAKAEGLNGELTLRVLVDRTSIEVFANQGKVSMSSCYVPHTAAKGLELFSQGRNPMITSFVVYELKPSWPSVRTLKGR